jgi:hypothetical protein
MKAVLRDHAADRTVEQTDIVLSLMLQYGLELPEFDMSLTLPF